MAVAASGDRPSSSFFLYTLQSSQRTALTALDGLLSSLYLARENLSTNVPEPYEQAAYKVMFSTTQELLQPPAFNTNQPNSRSLLQLLPNFEMRLLFYQLTSASFHKQHNRLFPVPTNDCHSPIQLIFYMLAWKYTMLAA